jgi:hypothetical protein
MEVATLKNVGLDVLLACRLYALIRDILRVTDESLFGFINGNIRRQIGQNTLGGPVMRHRFVDPVGHRRIAVMHKTTT